MMACSRRSEEFVVVLLIRHARAPPGEGERTIARPAAQWARTPRSDEAGELLGLCVDLRRRLDDPGA